MKKAFHNLWQLVLISFLFGATVMAQQSINWGTQADNLRGRNGQQFTFTCPGNGTISGRIWGTDIYTDDSSICTAAAHAGLISVQQGGIVTIEIRAGLSSYAASTRNGITTRSYGSWGGSFVFVGKGSNNINNNATTISWGDNVTSQRGLNGQQFTYFCPSGGTVSSSIWGTDLYTDDTSVCTAAVHAGLITAQSGGTVTVEIRAGAASYAGSTRNGVTSKGYGSWQGSFVFVRKNGGGNTGGATSITWTTQADGWRGQNGKQIALQCPAGGSISSRLWGTDLYTDDSSICTAAVHAGLISVSAGGSVVIEIRPGASRYAPSTRYGVTSKEYGAWSGSFVFVIYHAT
jgi:hypothetical protein